MSVSVVGRSSGFNSFRPAFKDDDAPPTSNAEALGPSMDRLEGESPSTEDAGGDIDPSIRSLRGDRCGVNCVIAEERGV